MNDNITQLANAISQGLTDRNTFTVTPDATSNRVYVDFNLADTQFQMILTQRGVKHLFRVIVEYFPASGQVAVSDEWHLLEWSAGIPRMGAGMARQFRSGTSVDLVKTAEMKLGQNGLEQAYAYTINSGAVLGQVKQLVKQAGYRLKVDTNTMIGLTVAGVTVALLLVFGLLVATGVLKLQTTSNTTTGTVQRR